MRHTRLIFQFAFSVLFLFAQQLRAQYTLDDIQPYLTIYDSAEAAKLPPLDLFSGKFNQSPDSVFSGFVNLATGKEYLSCSYPYAASSMINYEPVKGGKGFFLPELVVNPSQPALSYLSKIYITDEYLRITDSITLGYSYTYIYRGDTLAGKLVMDPHDAAIVEHNGKKYAFLIGYRMELADESTLMHHDSVMIRYSTIHVIDVAAHKEVARFEPEKQGFKVEAFYDPRNLTRQAMTFHYSHPHINILEPHIAAKGWDIFFSSRDPGVIGKLYWDGASDSLNLVWLFGSSPKTPVAKYISAVSQTPISGCHGSSAMYRGDTLYIATYNNNSQVSWPRVNSSRFQVYKVFSGKASLVWQSPDIHFSSSSRGQAVWCGDQLLCAHGRDGGIIKNVNEDTSKYTYLPYCDRLQIWQPFSNKLTGILRLPGDINYIGWVDSLPALHSVQLTLHMDSIVLSCVDTGLKYWTIGSERKMQKELSLPVAFIDSLKRISAWVQTGYSGVWQVTEKEVPNLLPAKLKKTMLARLPRPYIWKIFAENNVSVNPEKVTPGSYYIFEACLGTTIVYRKKHWVEK